MNSSCHEMRRSKENRNDKDSTENNEKVTAENYQSHNEERMLTNREKSRSVSKAKAEEETVGKQIVIFQQVEGVSGTTKTKPDRKEASIIQRNDDDMECRNRLNPESK